MIIATKGKGAEIKWVDEIETKNYDEIVKLKEEVQSLKKQNDMLLNKLSELLTTIDRVKLDNIAIVKGLISR